MAFKIDVDARRQIRNAQDAIRTRLEASQSGKLALSHKESAAIWRQDRDAFQDDFSASKAFAVAVEDLKQRPCSLVAHRRGRASGRESHRTEMAVRKLNAECHGTLLD